MPKINAKSILSPRSFPWSFPWSFLRSFPCPSFVVAKLAVIALSTLLYIGSHDVSCAQQPAIQEDPQDRKADGKSLEFLRIGTSPPDETLYRLGSALTGSLSAPPDIKPPCRDGYPCGVPGLLLVTQSRAGSFESLEDMARGTLESAIVSIDVLNEIITAATGTYAFDTSRLNLLARLSAVQLHIVVLDDSKFSRIEDLTSRTIAVGISGSAYALQLRNAMASIGKNVDSVVTVDLPLHEALDKLATREIDAVALTGQAPLPILQTFARKVPIRLIDVGSPKQGQQQQQMQKQGIAYAVNLPAQTYPGQKKELHTLAFDVWWVVSKELERDSVYRITRALWHKSTQKMVRALVPEVLIEKPRALHLLAPLLPIHPGAAKWYRQKGLLAS